MIVLIPAFVFQAAAQAVFTKPVVVKVLSFNILHGATAKGDFNLEVLADVIKKCDPDLVALQEVDYKTKRASGYDLATELGWRTKMAPLFGKAMSFDGGEYGVGIMSKTSIINSRLVALPHSPANEPRAALEISTVLTSGDTICFVGTHLDHQNDSPDRLWQVETINQVFGANNYPTLLAGDMNDVPGSKTISNLEKVWQSSYDKTNPQPTWPSDKPKVKIDYVMRRPASQWRLVSTRVIRNVVASDHCAYLVILELIK